MKNFIVKLNFIILIMLSSGCAKHTDDNKATNNSVNVSTNVYNTYDDDQIEMLEPKKMGEEKDSTNRQMEEIQQEDEYSFFKVTDFKELPKLKSQITGVSLLQAIYEVDSTRIIHDFNVYLQLSENVKRIINRVPINPRRDTVYICSVYDRGDFRGTGGVSIWNSRGASSCRIFVDDDYDGGYKSGRRDWEEELIRSWDVDSICRLTRPTFYKRTMTNNPIFYVFQIVIKAGNARYRCVAYSRLYLPFKFIDDKTQRRE